jgi:hypothetical protein
MTARKAKAKARARARARAKAKAKKRRSRPLRDDNQRGEGNGKCEIQWSLHYATQEPRGSGRDDDVRGDVRWAFAAGSR